MVLAPAYSPPSTAAATAPLSVYSAHTPDTPLAVNPPYASLGDPTRIDHEVVELQLLLPRWQAAALAQAAQARGMTSGQILRRVISDLFAESSSESRA